MNSLELSGADLRDFIDLVATRLAEFVDSLPDQPTWNTEEAESVARSVNVPPPATGRKLDEVLDQLFGEIIPVCYNTASPGYFAYIPGGGLTHSAVADLIAGVTNRYASVWTAGPAIAQIESAVIRWFCDMVGYPMGAGGFLTSGGSLANWSALVTARRTRLPADYVSGTIYTSDQAHHSVAKAAMLAGFPPENTRSIGCDSLFKIRIDLLDSQIKEDRNRGLQPFAVVGQAGTTNTGAVDDLGQLADLCQREHLWLHVDGAYGGFFAMTDRGRERLRGLERADSVTLDPHKGLFLPYGTGCLLVRRQEQLEEAHRVDGDYMPPMQSDPDFVDFCNISPELSRDWRGLRLWLPLQMCGTKVFETALNEKLDLAQWACQQLQQISCLDGDRLEIVAEPQLSILAFRLRRDRVEGPELDQLNRQLLQRINESRRVFLTPTTLNGQFVIRICVLCFRTHHDRMEICLDEIRRAVLNLKRLR